MRRSVRHVLALVFVVLVPVAAAVHSETYIWVDEAGITHMTNDPDAVPAAQREGRHSVETRAELWDGPVGARPLAGGAARDGAEARTQRLIAGAVSDLERGESARATVALEAVLREQPKRPEPHWYLARLNRHRGRFVAAESHLRAFLASAGDELESWRTQAERSLAELEDERRLSDASRAEDPERFAGLASENFDVVLDPQLRSGSNDYARTVLGYLEESREAVATRLGDSPREQMGVVFYGRASYDKAHRKRFSFRTVGFFDGRIHVVSAAHPAGELRALLFHEYVHAVFRERTGSDRPYWWNEGLAELNERISRGRPGLTRSERSSLWRRIEADDWIPLRRLAPSFSGLDDGDARAAYLEAAAAASWIEERTAPDERSKLLELLGAGRRDDEAFLSVMGIDTAAIDRGVRAWIRSEFRSTSAASRALDLERP
jgi:hypothetical protein